VVGGGEFMTASLSVAIDAARILVARRLSGEQGARLPERCRPTSLQDAFDIQRAVSALLGDARGERVKAWKCALPAAERLVAAPIYARTVHAASPCPAWTRAGQVRVEPELAFVLGRDLPPRDAPYAPEEVDAAIASTHLALELIDSRYSPDDAAEASFAEKLADGLVNQGLFIGPAVDAETSRLASDFDIRVRLADGGEAHHVGHHPNGLPRSPLYWLAEFLRSQGQGLLAGQAVITGSYAGSFTLPLGQDIAIQYGDLGSLSVHFTSLTTGGPGESPTQ
jgi:2-keto-4-pentenoate hydratase